jgi:hypothetical protein
MRNRLGQIKRNSLSAVRCTERMCHHWPECAPSHSSRRPQSHAAIDCMSGCKTMCYRGLSLLLLLLTALGAAVCQQQPQQQPQAGPTPGISQSAAATDGGASSAPFGASSEPSGQFGLAASIGSPAGNASILEHDRLRRERAGVQSQCARCPPNPSCLYRRATPPVPGHSHSRILPRPPHSLPSRWPWLWPGICFPNLPGVRVRIAHATHPLPHSNHNLLPYAHLPFAMQTNYVGVSSEYFDDAQACGRCITLQVRHLAGRWMPHAVMLCSAAAIATRRSA